MVSDTSQKLIAGVFGTSSIQICKVIGELGVIGLGSDMWRFCGLRAER